MGHGRHSFDSEIMHMQALLDMMGHQGELTSEQQALKNKCHGLSDQQVFHLLSQAGFLKDYTEQNFIQKKDEHFAKLIAQTHNEQFIKPEIKILLDQLLAAGFKMALVTSAERFTTDLLLEKSGF